jgi:hypothetical protein
LTTRCILIASGAAPNALPNSVMLDVENGTGRHGTVRLNLPWVTQPGAGVSLYHGRRILGTDLGGDERRHLAAKHDFRYKSLMRRVKQSGLDG